MNDAIRMQISAFVDGELPDNEADLLLRRMGQDAELRRKAAEYLEIGRAMRGEASVAGIDRLLERVTASIDDRPVEIAPVEELIPEKKNGMMRPLFGAAVAASVALLAIFGLQLQPGSELPDMATTPLVQETVPPVQLPIDEELRQFYVSHGATSSQFGANGMNARLVTLRFSEEVLPESEDEAATADEADDARPMQR